MPGGLFSSITGTDQVLARLDNLKPMLNGKVKAALKMGAKACYDNSQDACPVGKNTGTTTVSHGSKTYTVHMHNAGSLKGSGKITQVSDYIVEVGYGGESKTGEYVKYQWYVELGTYKMQAQPYLMPAYIYAKQLVDMEFQRILTFNNM